MTAGRGDPYLRHHIRQRRNDRGEARIDGRHQWPRACGQDEGEGLAERDTVSKERRIAFGVIAVITALWFLVFFGFGMLEVIFMWFPASTLFAGRASRTSSAIAHTS